jgi:xyloglucan-specific exo-beta-1,4-glucanase
MVAGNDSGADGRIYMSLPPWLRGNAGKVSTDGGHNFTLSQGSVSANLHANAWFNTSMEVNPNVEGDIWLADGNAVYHSLDSGATWTKRSDFASVWPGQVDDGQPTLQGATTIALGKAAPGASYSATVYVVGTINGVRGLYRSADGGASWARFNDDAHQYGGFGMMAADWNTYGRVYVGGNGRGVLYTN